MPIYRPSRSRRRLDNYRMGGGLFGGWKWDKVAFLIAPFLLMGLIVVRYRPLVIQHMHTGVVSSSSSRTMQSTTTTTTTSTPSSSSTTTTTMANSNKVGGGEDDTNKKVYLRFGEETIPEPICTNPQGGEECRKVEESSSSTTTTSTTTTNSLLNYRIEESSSTTTTNSLLNWKDYEDEENSSSYESKNHLYTCNGQCSVHATCYFGTCLCHPGYEGHDCNQKMEIANPWYTADCPNLQTDTTTTLDVNRSGDALGGYVDCPNNEHADDFKVGLSYCAYLCYSSEVYGSAIVPHSLWQKAQQAENILWNQMKRSTNNDRYREHFQGFANYNCLQSGNNISLGDVLEIGAGPWTQFRGLLHHQPNLEVNSYTILEPGADFYRTNVDTCAYKTGDKLTMWPDASKFHDFPIHIISKLGETAATTTTTTATNQRHHQQQYDTVMVVNVIEHVQNAVDFLHGIHRSLKPGGLLIFHERYYSEPELGDAVLGRNVFHPIRLTKSFFDHFLSVNLFDIIFNNCEGHTTIQGWKRRNKGERGYYVIARKRKRRRKNHHMKQREQATS